MPGVALDAGGLIALDRNDRRVVVLLARARETDAHAVICARRATSTSLHPIPAISGSWTRPFG
jgi:hypothetical protein